MQKKQKIQTKNSNKKVVWFDIRHLKRESDAYKSIIKHIQKMDSCSVIIDESQYEDIKGEVKKVLIVDKIINDVKKIIGKYEVLAVDNKIIESEWFKQNKELFKNKVAPYIRIDDKESLEEAVQMTKIMPRVIVEFKDETKIPLEIVLADAQNNNCEVIMNVTNELEARVVFGVLECGADGVIFKVNDLNDLYSIYEEVKYASQKLEQELVEMEVVETYYAGMGERACIDVISKLELDEGILIGSFSNGGILACSETHPLPYMPTRPFRVNAGTLQSYVLAPDNQTWYLSDIRAGMEVLAVSTSGKARRVTVGRIKIERRPILGIVAKTKEETVIKVFMQADWHVRIFDTNSKPLNITELKPGDKILGYTAEPGRHVGVKVDEVIVEQ